MMKPIEQTTFCVISGGLFQPLAHCLATKAKRVLIWSPECREVPSVIQDCMGRGFPDIKRVREFWPRKHEIDCFCFPDCSLPGLQMELQSQGFPVWGSRYGVDLELDREKFMDTLKEIGLNVPPFKVCVGMDELRPYLKDNTDKYVKLSRFRGDMETHHWTDWESDEGWLEWLAFSLGPMKDHLRFLVFDKIDTDLEIGGDTYNVRGKWPRLMLNGLEYKDATYFSAVTTREEMPEQIQEILTVIGPVLERYGYINQISFEDRVKGDDHWWIDATQRGGKPSSGTQELIWKNFPEIIWAGANGELLEPEPAAKFSLECMVTAEAGDQPWIRQKFDPALFPWLRLSDCALSRGVHCFPQEEAHSGELGWLVALGDTPNEVLDRAKELADLLPDGCDAKLENLVGLIKEVETAKKEDIPFTDEPIPAPGEVVAD
jgi:hypothetical protein